MSNSIAIDNDISRLHPAIRDAVALIRKQLHSEKIPFEVFEAFRTPERQAELYSQGRTRPGDKVTWALPWQSMHQYGLAVDFVLKVGGKWSWDDSGPEAAYWTRLHELARAQRMTPLYNKQGKLIEAPHVQLVGLTAERMQAGDYPAGGDALWAEHLTNLIANWTGPQAAPPRPQLMSGRPALAEADIKEFEKAHRGVAARETVATTGDARSPGGDVSDPDLRTNSFNLCRYAEMSAGSGAVGAVANPATQVSPPGGPVNGGGAARPSDPAPRPPLTPVNAVLGEGIGRLLNGKKSVIGIVGLLATVLLPEIGLSGPIVDFVQNHETELSTLLGALTGWGFLGKLDKSIWSVNQQV